MKILEGDCPDCHGNLIFEPDKKLLRCEDCPFTRIIKYKLDMDRTWVRAHEFGPKELRHKFTRAGEQLVTGLQRDEVPSEEILGDVVDAHRGMVEDEAKIKELKEGGFIL